MEKKLIVFDMDGTVYLGKDLLPGAKEVFDFLKKKKIDYVFFTNNSSHDLDFYYQKIKAFGIPCDKEKNFHSSTEVTIDYLLEKGIKEVFLIGNESLKKKFRKHFVLIEKYGKNEQIDAVIAGFSTEYTYEELRDAALYLQTRDVPFIATNGDFRCPIEDGLYIPDCGGICEMLTLCTGKKPMVMGKPNPEVLFDLARRFNVRKEEILAVGDRLYTDILVGVNAGVDTLCVLSGECTKEDIEAYPHKPTYILPSIADLPSLLK